MKPSDDDGWTQVLKGRKSAHPQSTDPYYLNPVDSTRTAQNIKADFELKMKAWQTSSCRTLYFKTLDQRAPDDGWPITKAVCLASGSFSRSNYESRQRSLFQFAAFVDTVRHIQGHSSTTTAIRILVQDPAYTPTDEQFLSDMGFEVLHCDIHDVDDDLGPAESHLGAHTMLAELCIDCGANKLRKFCSSDAPLFAFSSFLGFVTRENRLGNITRGGPPGQKPTYQDVWFGDNEDDAHLAEKFLERYSVYKLPEFEHSPNTFRSMAALIRRPDDEEE